MRAPPTTTTTTRPAPHHSSAASSSLRERSIGMISRSDHEVVRTHSPCALWRTRQKRADKSSTHITRRSNGRTVRPPGRHANSRINNRSGRMDGQTHFTRKRPRERGSHIRPRERGAPSHPAQRAWCTARSTPEIGWISVDKHVHGTYVYVAHGTYA